MTEHRHFVQLDVIALENLGDYSFDSIWIDPEVVYSISGFFDGKEHHTVLFLSSGETLEVKGKPVEIAHRLGIKLPDPTLVPEPPKRIRNREVKPFIG